MEVHLGKFDSEQYDCGLCDYVATRLENLETHLFTCETYQCDKCDIRSNKISDMKTHIKNNHENVYFQIICAKQCRFDSEEINVTEYRKYFFVDNI